MDKIKEKEKLNHPAAGMERAKRRSTRSTKSGEHERACKLHGGHERVCKLHVVPGLVRAGALMKGRRPDAGTPLPAGSFESERGGGVTKSIRLSLLFSLPPRFLDGALFSDGEICMLFFFLF